MSNENTQDDALYEYEDTYLEVDASATTQTLVLNAYLDEKQKWEDNIKSTSELLALKIKEQIDIEKKIFNQSKLVKFAKNIFGKKSKQEKKLSQISEEIEKLKNTFAKVSNSPPSPDAYELALLGALFKAR